MSGRGATPAVLTEWGKEVCITAHLYEIDFNPIVYLTDYTTDITWNGNQYLAAYGLGYSAISETSELLVNSCTISLSGVDQAVVAALLQETYLNRKIKVRLAMVDVDRVVHADPVLIFDGRMNRPTVVTDPDSGTVVCTVEGVSHWTDFERRKGRHSNNVEQQSHFPGDLGFANVASLPDQIFWGVQQVFGSRNDTPSSGGGRGRYPPRPVRGPG